MGIEIVREVPWGTHFCYFYLAKEDLLDLLIQYFKLGLENNEFCVWILSNDISIQEAHDLSREKIPDFQKYLKKKQFDIIPFEKFLIRDGTLNSDKAIKNWVQKSEFSSENNFEGLRISKDLRWLKRRNFNQFINLETELYSKIGDLKIKAMCSFPINKFRKDEFLDIANAHQFALINKEGNYKLVENFEHKRIEEEKKTISVLSSGGAHDFNNLLTIIKGNVDMAMMTLQNDKKSPIYKYLQEIRESINSAKPLVRRLYNFDRNLPLEVVPINLNKILIKLMQMLTLFSIEDVNIEIKNDFEPNIWKISADPAKIERALMNLIINAKEAMPKGGKIFVRTKNLDDKELNNSRKDEARRGNHVCISVEDTGTGMDEETLKRIFKPYFTTKKNGKGRGLGLLIVQSVVKEHGGWIDVESEKNKGTTFKIYLPAMLED